MPLIAVDIGNSAAKISLPRHQDQPVKRGWVILDQNWDVLQPSLPEEPLEWWISAVDPAAAGSLRDWLTRHRRQDLACLITHDRIPMSLDVRHPEKVGIDRLLAAYAAFLSGTPGTARIVVDAGTAVTCDVVDRQGTFRGGLIFPGIDAPFRQLHQQTAALPRFDHATRLGFWQEYANADFGPTPVLLGRDTTEAILLGVFQTQLRGLGGLISDLQRRYSGAEVIVTGRGMQELQDAAHSLAQQGTQMDGWEDHRWQQRPDLVLEGIAAISQQAEA